MRIIITGGSGLIGRALTSSLAADGHEVIILSRDPAKVRGLPQNAHAEKWDGRTAQGWGHLAEGAGAIVNLAGVSIAGENLTAILFKRWSSGYKRQIRESRANVGAAVVEAVRAAKQKPGVVMQASAVGYYGPHGDEALTEASPPGDDFQARVCQEWEASTAAVEEMGVRRVIIRTGLPLSRKGGVFPLIILPFKLFVGGPLGSGKQWFPWLHIEDQVAAMRFLIDSGASGPFNLCAPNPVTNAALSRMLGRVMRRPVLIPVPAFVLRLALGEKADIVLGGWRQIPKRLREMGFLFKFPELEPALRDLLQ
ncbi:MAG: TIGR01777 family oxidoreductase [Anaerolineales bacterium]